LNRATITATVQSIIERKILFSASIIPNEEASKISLNNKMHMSTYIIMPTASSMVFEFTWRSLSRMTNIPINNKVDKTR